MSSCRTPFRSVMTGYALKPYTRAESSLSCDLIKRRIADSLSDPSRNSKLQGSEWFTGQPETAHLQKWDPSGEGSHGVAQMLRWSYLAAAFNPACSASAAALSVASQVNSGSVRPKWPYAAVFW